MVKSVFLHIAVFLGDVSIILLGTVLGYIIKCMNM